MTAALTAVAAWAASTAYAVGDSVLLGAVGLLCTTAGTSGATAPAAPGLALSVVDGTVHWVQVSTPVTDELTAADVDHYTGGRLAADDPETTRMLNAALAAARNDVDWHVSPVYAGVTLIRNGPGGCKLRLPTKNIVRLNSITDRGVSLNVDQTTAWPPGPDVTVDAEVGWLLHRHHGHWSQYPRSIVVNMDHGLTPDEASDWRQAILSIVDQMSTLIAVGRPDSELESKEIDDVTYRWMAAPALPSVEPILQKYRLCYGVA